MYIYDIYDMIRVSSFIVSNDFGVQRRMNQPIIKTSICTSFMISWYVPWRYKTNDTLMISFHKREISGRIRLTLIPNLLTYISLPVNTMPYAEYCMNCVTLPVSLHSISRQIQCQIIVLKRFLGHTDYNLVAGGVIYVSRWPFITS